MSWLPRQVPPKSFGDEWIGQPFGASNHFRITLDPYGPRAHEYIVLAAQAANVDVELLIPYPHRFSHIEFKHTTASNVDDVTAHTFYFARWKWGTAVSPFLIYASVGSVATDDIRIAAEGYEWPPGRYRLRVSGTENYHVYPEFIIQVLGKPLSETGQKGKEYTSRRG